MRIFFRKRFKGQLFRQWKDSNQMLLVSHEMSFVRNVATRVIFLDGGKILEDGTPREVFGNPKNERVKEFFTKINRMEEPDYSI